MDKFYVGYFDNLHSDPAVNFELNRWINYLGDTALEDFRTILPELTDFSACRRAFLSLANKALYEGRKVNAAFYYRLAEFYMFTGDAEKMPTRQNFLDLIREYYGVKDNECIKIPYEDDEKKGFLLAYRFTPPNPKSIIVMFGGADSYIEEFFPIVFYLRDAGYDVICFEGPGQGGVLLDYKILLTAEWHKPVKTILDYFHVDDVTLWGISLGGALVLRAAAYEPRASRVICDDIAFNSFDAFLSKLKPGVRAFLKLLINLKASGIINAALRGVMRKRMELNWAIQQFSQIMGVKSPYEFMVKVQTLKTGDISHLVKQDVLLMAGTEDTMVPIDQFYKQIEALKNVRSLTARMFTRAEHAQNHCQIGNLGLQNDIVMKWIDTTIEHSKSLA